MHRLLLAVLTTVIGANVAFAEEVKLPERSKFHLYILIGQSNMAGRGEVEPQDKEPHPRVLMFTKSQTWAPAVDPLHFDKPKIAGVGLGSTFGRVMAEQDPDVVIGLIPCAVGGTPLKRWSEGGDLFEQAVQRAKVAIKDGTLRGVLWHQGEAETNNEELSRSYGTRLAAMVEALRKTLDAPDVPFVAGKLGEFLYELDRAPYAKVVNEQIKASEKVIPNFACVESEGLKAKSDQIHFDSASLREFGKRYAQAMLQLQKRTSAAERE